MKRCCAIESRNLRDRCIEHWENQYGSAPPKALRTQTLSLAYAYEQQIAEQSPLSPKVLSQLLSASVKKAAPLHKTPGMRFVREWRGKEYTVDVHKDGYLYQNKRYKSLSEIARLITGTRWSGPRFFKANS